MKTIYGFILIDADASEPEDSTLALVFTKEGQEILHPDRLKGELTELGSHPLMENRYHCPVEVEVEPKITLVNGVLIGGFEVSSEYHKTHKLLANTLKAKYPEWNIVVITPEGLATLIRNDLAIPTIDTIGDGMECIYKKHTD